MLAALRKQESREAAKGRQLDRHPSIIAREIRRNQCNDGAYRPSKADRRTRGPRSRSRRNLRLGPEGFRLLESLLPHLWSPQPKVNSMHFISQRDCSLIADALNATPRKRLGYKTPQKCANEDLSPVQFKLDAKRQHVTPSVN